MDQTQLIYIDLKLIHDKTILGNMLRQDQAKARQAYSRKFKYQKNLNSNIL
jgi:hypothetical protein